MSLYGYEAKDEAAKNVSEEFATAAARLFRYGERLRFSAKLYPPRNFRNPGAFDYAGYLAENGIVALGPAKAGDNLEMGGTKVAVLAPHETPKRILPGRTTSLWS